MDAFDLLEQSLVMGEFEVSARALSSHSGMSMMLTC